MKAPDVIVIDAETEAIQARPKYPPVPTSIGIKWPDQREYKLLSWSHPSGNNCTKKEAYGELRRAYNSRYPLLFQNSSFDLDVFESHFELQIPSWEKVHDTVYLLFLWDPHSETLALKPAAEKLLGIAPEEQNLMNEWILANILEAKRKPSSVGEYICKCPFKIVAPYLKGDLTRTLKIFQYLHPRVLDVGMGCAYDRERQLMPILLRNAQVGMRMDVNGLERDLPVMKSAVEKADVWLRKRLGIENLDSDRQLGQALHDKGIVKEFKLTPKGQLSVSKKHLIIGRFLDKKVYHALQYRGQLATCINMFYEPWLAYTTESKGILFPNWIQVRAAKNGGRDNAGASTGRIICNRPNLLNLPREWKRAASAGYVHPAWLRVPELPLMRKYCLPDKGELWGKRDFSSQELRLFAHYEEGPVMQGFLNDPKYDIHELVRAEAEQRLQEANLRDSFDRDTAKTCNFGRLYGQGIAGLLDALHLPEEDKPVAQIIQRAINTALPSIKELDDKLKELAHDKDYGPNGAPLRTWGGRLYYCEPPQYSEKYGRNMTFEYRMLNILLQGGGADVTKETLIRYHNHPKRKGRFTVTVYDEVSFSAAAKQQSAEHKILNECMLSIETDVPMLSDGATGPSWGELKKI